MFINPRRACARVTVVVSVCVYVCVCVSVKSHLTLGASVRPKNAVTNSASDEGRKICGVFSKTHAFLRSSAPSLGWPYIRSAIFSADNTHAHCAYARFAIDSPYRKVCIALRWSIWVIAHCAYSSSARFAIDSPCRKLCLRSV